MAKPPAQRYQHAEDLVVDLAALRRAVDAGDLDIDAGNPNTDAISALPVAPVGRRTRLLTTILAIVTLASLALAAWLATRPAAPAAGPVARFDVLFSPDNDVTLYQLSGSAVDHRARRLAPGVGR